MKIKSSFGLLLFLLLAGSVAAAEADTALAMKTVNGEIVHPLATAGRKATVMIFVWHTCPVANSYAPEIERIHQDYKDKEVALFVVHVDPSLKEDKARQHARDYAYTLPVLVDREHVLVKHTGATMTPEAVVLLPDGKRIYHGRIDNRQAALGKRRPQATEFDLRDTLDAILAGKELQPRSTEVIGCYVPE